MDGSMLLFYCAAGDDLGRLRAEGLRLRPGGRAALRDSLEEVLAACPAGPVLVVDGTALPARRDGGDGTGGGLIVPPEAMPNLDPYRPPRPVTAAGGYVVRSGSDGPEVLLIFRRGVWDLPKGKLDEGETVEACALREVREELGIRRLRLGQALGSTVHGYAEKGVYRVKTTRWYLMETPEERFRPQAREGIEAVRWTPWPEAVRAIGFETLRAHLRGVEAAVRAHLEGRPEPA